MTLNFISLGWGVQSFTLAAMSALGELPKVDAAIHADTTHERSATYAFAAKWTPWLEQRGIRVVVVGDFKQTATVSTHKTDIPAFTYSPQSYGQLRRQCTQRWKITPMRRWISEELANLGLRKQVGVVRQWLGISLDEMERMKPSDVRYIETVWPIIDKRMTRADCVRWLLANGLEVPPKSSCVFCPYHNAVAWSELRQTPADFEKAAQVDSAIRKCRPPYDLFVHPARKPLIEIDVRTPQERGQLELFQGEECAGVCFV